MKELLGVLLFIGMTGVFISQTLVPKSAYNGLNLSLADLFPAFKRVTPDPVPESPALPMAGRFSDGLLEMC